MSITDELREFYQRADGYELWCPRHRKEIAAIADRIDEAHKHAIAYVDDRDPETMAEHGWVKLPLDADGVPIHAGDMLDVYGKTIEVVEIRHGRSGWVIISRDGNGYADTFAFTHHHAPTVEDVLTEFANVVCNSGHQWGLDAADTIAEYAAKLRLAGDGE